MRYVMLWSGIALLLLQLSHLGTQLRALEHDGNIGPIAWGTVLTSPTLLTAAVRLARTPACLRTRDAALPLNASLDATLRPALRWSAGRLAIMIDIVNRADRAVIVPPLWSVGSVEPRHCVSTDVYVTYGPALAPGATVLDPGDRCTVTLAFTAPPQPTRFFLVLVLNRGEGFLITPAANDPHDWSAATMTRLD